MTKASALSAALALESASLIWTPIPKSFAVITPSVGVVIVLPDCAVNVFAVN